MSTEKLQVCSVCGVKILKIIGGDRVIFATGAHSTRDVLYQRVCQHTEKNGCINKNGQPS
ncbi:MAG: hypothetical protein VKJ24_02650 [Synechococcales bacterium]|nr:hypothetical protein [Synechococcales bacterium]